MGDYYIVLGGLAPCRLLCIPNAQLRYTGGYLPGRRQGGPAENKGEGKQVVEMVGGCNGIAYLLIPVLDSYLADVPIPGNPLLHVLQLRRNYYYQRYTGAAGYCPGHLREGV